MGRINGYFLPTKSWVQQTITCHFFSSNKITLFIQGTILDGSLSDPEPRSKFSEYSMSNLNSNVSVSLRRLHVIPSYRYPMGGLASGAPTRTLPPFFGQLTIGILKTKLLLKHLLKLLSFSSANIPIVIPIAQLVKTSSHQFIKLFFQISHGQHLLDVVGSNNFESQFLALYSRELFLSFI